MNILVTDDSKFARLSLIRTLKQIEPSAQFIEAENGLVAVEYFKNENPDVVFLDLTMPVMDGFEALKHMITINPEAQIVVISADIQTQAQQQVLSLGAKMMVPKPINTEKMTAILNQLVFSKEN